MGRLIIRILFGYLFAALLRAADRRLGLLGVLVVGVAVLAVVAAARVLPWILRSGLL